MPNRRNRNVALSMIFIGLICIGPSQSFAQTPPEESSPSTLPTAGAGAPSIEDKPLNLPENMQDGDTSSGGGSPFGGFWSGPWLALAAVIVIILVAAAVLRRAYPGARSFASIGGVQVLGRAHISPKQVLALIKVDQRLVLLGLTEQNVNHLLTISDPDEVSRLTEQVKQHRSGSVAGSFMHLFSSEHKRFSEQESASRSTDDSTGGAEQDVFELKARLNSLLDKVSRLKGSGGRG